MTTTELKAKLDRLTADLMLAKQVGGAEADAIIRRVHQELKDNERMLYADDEIPPQHRKILGLHNG